ncbi:MAG: DUF1697 domain-containing protein [Eubacteriales bacterium]|nr:DUF1697 domain-containing protein [Eubacteriales bacterium]
MIALLRGVTPTGKNRIPKMSYLAEVLQNAGLRDVKTYIQSGNIIFNTELAESEVKILIHDCIKQKIGADLSVILKTSEQLKRACKECPFGEEYDITRVHLVFTNDTICTQKLSKLLEMDFGDEVFAFGKECLYMYLPKNAEKKRLNNNFLERQLGITATMRKFNVVQHLSEL